MMRMTAQTQHKACGGGGNRLCRYLPAKKGWWGGGVGVGDGGVEGGFSATLECYQRWRGTCD